MTYHLGLSIDTLKFETEGGLEYSGLCKNFQKKLIRERERGGGGWNNGMVPIIKEFLLKNKQLISIAKELDIFSIAA